MICQDDQSADNIEATWKAPNAYIMQINLRLNVDCKTLSISIPC